MLDDVEEEAIRPRPLSTGIWTFFSWLRRSEQSSSSESISSVGSDHTAVSFDFLAPLQYKRDQFPVVLPHRPITDTYKKRLYDINLRKQQDRDLTLHSKYGLFKDEGFGYDGFSLPAARRIPKDYISRQDRDRRATSESIQRRAAYVPGKRRAPLPPIAISSSLPRNYKRKRPAPKPPVFFSGNNKENIELKQDIQMNSKSTGNRHSFACSDSSTVYKSDKCKQDLSKDVKLRVEKSFLKQIFDSKKRNSAIDTSHVKLLPSISELDKQAAEIIEMKKAFRLNRDHDTSTYETWMCRRCQRKYKLKISTCSYCLNEDNTHSNNAFNIYTQTDNDVNSKSNDKGVDEKKKLREMLKEMKDSLPKRPKNDGMTSNTSIAITESPTLRIGSKLTDKSLNITSKPCKFSEDNLKSLTKREILDRVITAAQPSSSQQNNKNLQSKLNDNKEDNVHGLLLQSNNVTSPNVNVSIDLVKENNKKIEITSSIKCVTNIHAKETSNNPTSSFNENIASTEKSRLDISKSDKIVDREINNKLEQSKEKVKHIAKEKKIENLHLGNVLSTSNVVQTTETLSSSENNVKLHTPLKISSLLSPLYCPKNIASIRGIESNKISTQTQQEKRVVQNNNVENLPSIPVTCSDAIPSTSRVSCLSNDFKQLNAQQKNTSPGEIKPTSKEKIDKTTGTNSSNSVTKYYVNHHARRRDLINRLEQAIAKGDEKAAAESASELAKLKLSCSVLSYSSQIVAEAITKSNTGEKENIAVSENDQLKLCSKEKLTQNVEKNDLPVPDVTIKDTNNQQKLSNDGRENEKKIGKIQSTDLLSTPSTSKQVLRDRNMEQISVWIEDKEAARGPIPMCIQRNAVMGELKQLAEKMFGLEIRLQRWIVGKTLCTDDNTPLLTLAGSNFKAPFYLCLVESETNKNTTSDEKAGTEIKSIVKEKNNLGSGDVYTELMKLEQQALVPNNEEFECGVCIEQCAPNNGAVLRECIHSFCKECLSDVVRHCEDPVVSCPAIGCPGVLQEREIRALLPAEEYERWLARGLAAAESGTRNTFHCRTRDCKGWAFCEPGVRKFPCPVCKHNNCLPCQAIHEGETCEQYQVKLREAVSAVELNQTDEGTQALLNSLIARGEAIECPECRAIITKKWGCDWIKCSACKTEICWVTKGRRWGPAGKGDTTGGCRCGVDGKRCHPSCGYCH